MFKLVSHILDASLQKQVEPQSGSAAPYRNQWWQWEIVLLASTSCRKFGTSIVQRFQRFQVSHCFTGTLNVIDRASWTGTPSVAVDVHLGLILGKRNCLQHFEVPPIIGFPWFPYSEELETWPITSKYFLRKGLNPPNHALTTSADGMAGSIGLYIPMIIPCFNIVLKDY